MTFRARRLAPVSNCQMLSYSTMRHLHSPAFVLLAITLGACGESTAPVRPIHPTITAGVAHSCMLTETGAASCWGENSYGELGNGTKVSSVNPVPVAGGIEFTTISAGGAFTCGLDRAGAAYCWGTNFNSLLGNGTAVQSASIPSPVSGGHGRRILLGPRRQRTTRGRRYRDQERPDARHRWALVQRDRGGRLPHLRADDERPGLLLGDKRLGTARQQRRTDAEQGAGPRLG
jgi:hypothetical protein